MQHTNSAIFIESIQCSSFRCFEQLNVRLESQVVLLEGLNGSGKTSFLEALYYSCYLRSFRTHIHRELLRFSNDTFFIKLLLRDQELHHTIQVGYSQAKRIVKIDDKSVASYKQLIGHYRVISIVEDDLLLIKEGPELRRSFLDNAILLMSPEYINLIRQLRQIVDQRNTVIRTKPLQQELYHLWTEKLVDISAQIRHERIKMLDALSQETNVLLCDFFDAHVNIKFTYINKKTANFENANNFAHSIEYLKNSELRFGRSLFGAHLDDFEIIFQGKNARMFASRGQQKLILVLIKIAQLRLIQHINQSAIILLDDFMSDFDMLRIERLVTILVNTGSQLFFTSPATQTYLHTALAPHRPQLVKLTL